MAKFITKPKTVEATQWFKYGDHPAVERYAISTPIVSEEPFMLGEPDDWFYYIARNDTMYTVESGNWIVEDDGEVFCFTSVAFNRRFDPVK